MKQTKWKVLAGVAALSAALSGASERVVISQIVAPTQQSQQQQQQNRKDATDIMYNNVGPATMKKATCLDMAIETLMPLMAVLPKTKSSVESGLHRCHTCEKS